MVHNGGEVEATMVKARFGTDIRKMTLRHNDDLSYNDLVMMMQRIFKIKSADNITLKYKDQEGDLITMADDHDLLLALQTEPLLSVVVLIDGAEISPLSKIRSELELIRDRSKALLDMLEVVVAGKGDQHSGLSVINCRSDTPPNILSESVATIQPSVHEQVNNSTTGVSGHPPAPCAAPPSMETTRIHPPNIPPAPEFIDDLQQQQQQHHQILQQQQHEVEQDREYNNTISDDTITTMTNNLPSSEVSSEVDITSTSIQHHPPTAPNGHRFTPLSNQFGGSEPPSTPMTYASAEVQAQTGAGVTTMAPPSCGQSQSQPTAPPPAPMMMMNSNSGSFGQMQQQQMTPPPQAAVPPTTASAPQFPQQIPPLSGTIPSVPTSQQPPMMMPPQSQFQTQQPPQVPQMLSSQPQQQQQQFGGTSGAPPQLSTGAPMGAQQFGGMPPPPPTSSGGMMMHQQQQHHHQQQMPPAPPATTATPTFGMPPTSGGVQMPSSQHQSGASTPAPMCGVPGMPPISSQPPTGGMMPPPPQVPSAQSQQQQQQQQVASFSTSSTPTPNMPYQSSSGAYHPAPIGGMMSGSQGAATPLGAPPMMPSFPAGGPPPGVGGGTANPFMRGTQHHYARPPFPNAFQQ